MFKSILNGSVYLLFCSYIFTNMHLAMFHMTVKSCTICQGAFHVVNPEDLRREIESLLGVAAYSLLPWRAGATIFCFTRRKCWRDGVIYNYYK